MKMSRMAFSVLLCLASIRILLASDVSLDVDTGDALHLVHDASSPVAAVISNVSSTVQAVAGRLEVRDWKGRGFTIPVSGTLPPEAVRRYPLPAPLPAKGFYWIRLFGDKSDKPVASTSFAFVERHKVTPLLAKPKFRFGFTDHPLYYAPEERRLLYDAFVASGAKLARVGLGAFGDVMSEGEGCFDWRESDEGVAAFRSRGISINATIYGKVPRWAAESNRVANCIRDKVEWAIGCMPPREGLFRDYCRALAARYGTQIDYYEIGNEFDMVPRWILPPDVALRLQREAWEGIKESCPTACVTTCGWAVGGSDDYFHKGKRLPNLGIMEVFLEKGRGWFDVLPVHLHGSFENYETRLNSRFFPLLKRYGVKQPWYSNETADHISGGREVPVAIDVWRKILYAWAHGSTDYTWYNLRAKAGRAGAGVEWAYGVMTHDWHPLPAFASFCALSAIFNGLDFECAYADGDKLKVYRFKGGDRVVLVGWTIGNGYSAVHLTTDAHEAALYDVMGQRTPLAIEDGKLEWKVMAEPSALVLSAATQLKVDCRSSSDWDCGGFPRRGLVAHRGNVEEFPESTIPAFRSAVAKGAEMIELDEWRCKTGELVVMHDHSVDRTTNGKGRIADLTLAEIKALDAGVKRGSQFAGLKVLTLDEALAAFPKTGLYLNIHCKTGDAAPEVAEILRRTGRLEQGILMMDSPEALAVVRSRCPWAKTGLVINTDAGWAKPWTEDEAWRKLKAAADAGVEFVQILPNCICTQEQFDYLHKRGIRTTYFVANDKETLCQKVAEGHDFIFTDRYSSLRADYDAIRHATTEVVEPKTTFAKDALSSYIASGELPGAVSVFYKDGVQEVACLGWANVAAKRPVTLDSPFMQCSQTKGFCGVTIAMLVEAGVLSLDDPVSKYLPEFKELWVCAGESNQVKMVRKAKNTMTVRMVMNHMSGLPFELPNYETMGGWSHRMPLRSVAVMAAAQPLLFEPGVRGSYSNLGIDVGAAIVEVISGMRWEDFLKKRVLDPLGMKDTVFRPTPEYLANKMELYAVSAGKAAKWLKDMPSMRRPYGDDRVFASAAAGLWTTPRDQLKFYKMLMNLGVGDNGARILKEETVKSLILKSTRPKGISGYSLGITAPETDNDDAWVGHGGARGSNCMFNWHKKELKLWVVQIDGKPRPANPTARNYARSCGVTDAVLVEATNKIPGFKLDSKQINGIDRKTCTMVKLHASGKIPVNFLEVMACPGGCQNGPCSLVK